VVVLHIRLLNRQKKSRQQDRFTAGAGYLDESDLAIARRPSHFREAEVELAAFVFGGEPDALLLDQAFAAFERSVNSARLDVLGICQKQARVYGLVARESRSRLDLAVHRELHGKHRRRDDLFPAGRRAVIRPAASRTRLARTAAAPKTRQGEHHGSDREAFVHFFSKNGGFTFFLFVPVLLVLWFRLLSPQNKNRNEQDEEEKGRTR
jgi:hypothetical protein